MKSIAARLLEPANLMSLARLPLAGLLWLAPDNRAFLVIIGLLAAISDWLDGLLGRRAHKSDPLTGTAHVGAWLDPLCDKAFVISAAVAVLVTYDPSVVVIALLLVRDALLLALLPLFRVVVGREAFHRHDYRAVASGKATTVAQFFTLLAIVFWPSGALPLAILAAALGLYAVLERAARAFEAAPAA